MTNSSDSILVPKVARNDTVPDTVSLGVEESYEWARLYFEEMQYGAARAMVWPYTRHLSSGGVDVMVGMTNCLAVIDWATQEYGRATRTLASVSPLVTTLSDRMLQGKYFNSYAMCEAAAGRFDAAFGYYRDSLECYTLAGARRYADDVDNNIAALLIRMGEPGAADRHITKALQSCDDPLTLAQILDTRAKQELAFGHFDEAKQLAADALSILCGLKGVETYIVGVARTLDDIRTAEVAQTEKTFA